MLFKIELVYTWYYRNMFSY